MQRFARTPTASRTRSFSERVRGLSRHGLVLRRDRYDATDSIAETFNALAETAMSNDPPMLRPNQTSRGSSIRHQRGPS